MRHVGIEAIQALPRYGAWARSAGRPCRQPVVGDSPRCHYHGAGGRTRGRRTGRRSVVRTISSMGVTALLRWRAGAKRLPQLDKRKSLSTGL
jgi:hypothetical protein